MSKTEQFATSIRKRNLREMVAAAGVAAVSAALGAYLLVAACAVVVGVCLLSNRQLDDGSALAVHMRREARRIELSPLWYFGPIGIAIGVSFIATVGLGIGAALCGTIIAAFTPLVIQNLRAAGELRAQAENLPAVA